MCGIVGYIGHRNAVPVLIKGLENLEYRGYDSAGIACLTEPAGSLRVVKEKGKLIHLKDKLQKSSFSSHLGIGHTRWATHGEPSRLNAHPHIDYHNRLAIIHNGIIENHAELKEELQKKKFHFCSQTDTEVAANLISYYYQKQNLLNAFKAALKRLKGFFAFVLMSEEEPEKLFVFKRSNPIVIGIGKNENFVASDVSALLPFTNKVVFLEDDEYAILTSQNVKIYSLQKDKLIHRAPTTIHWKPTEAAKGGYAHFMLKEIEEQPDVVKTILKTRIKKGKVFFEKFDRKLEDRLTRIRKIHFVSCGTAYHAGLVGNYMLGECLNLPVEATVSSEFRYEDPSVGKEDLVILISQSGETADTLAALREAKRKKAMTLAVVNVVGSTIAREADAVIYTHAGPEIGVASTKAYLAQLTIIALFSLYLSNLHKKDRKKNLSSKHASMLLNQMMKLPELIKETLLESSRIKRCAKELYRKQTFLYLGRGYNYPNALEGALKLKEITYSHAHGYPAGEMKHGPIALIDKNQPVICLAPESKTYEKMLSNIEEIKARKGIVISIATKGDNQISKISKFIFSIPKTPEMFSPLLTAIPLQLFAYYVAVLKKRDVDQPRNLAKSVTVE